MVVYKTAPDGVVATKLCLTCKNEKMVYDFEPNRKECRSCRGLEAVARAQKNVVEYISDIEKVKNDMQQLATYLEHIPKDSLILIITHYKVGRNASDLKSSMVLNIVKHFKALLSPNKCQGGCGCSVVEPHGTCKTCQEKPVCGRNETRQAFIDDLQNIVENLKPMTNRVVDIDRFNKDHLCMMARKLGLKFEQKIPKSDLFDLVNGVLETREKQREKEKAANELQLVVVPGKKIEEIVINDLTVQARLTDCYVNATMLCQAGNKKFNDWFRLDSTKKLIEVLSKNTGISIPHLINSKKGGSIHDNSHGSWVHPDLAVQIAQWVSPEFALRVSQWVREIVITGETHIDTQITNDQLIALQREYQKVNTQNKLLAAKHKSILQRREYYKFEKGPCFYIVRVNDNDFKLGYEGVDVNMRFRTYRTGNPSTRACHIVYSANASFIEQGMLNRFQHKKLEQNHEVVTDVSLSDLVQAVHTIVEYFHLDYHVVPAESLEKYNES